MTEVASPTTPGVDPVPDKVELDREVLLPGPLVERDGCHDRLTRGLAGMRGVTRAHVEDNAGRAILCVHYDPALATLAEVERPVRRAGADLQARYHHERIPVEGMDCSDCTLAIEHVLRRTPGVLAASVNYAAATCTSSTTATRPIARQWSLDSGPWATACRGGPWPPSWRSAVSFSSRSSPARSSWPAGCCPVSRPLPERSWPASTPPRTWPAASMSPVTPGPRSRPGASTRTS